MRSNIQWIHGCHRWKSNARVLWCICLCLCVCVLSFKWLVIFISDSRSHPHFKSFLPYFLRRKYKFPSSFLQWMIHESYILFNEKFKLSGRASGLWISQKRKTTAKMKYGIKWCVHSFDDASERTREKNEGKAREHALQIDNTLTYYALNASTKETATINEWMDKWMKGEREKEQERVERDIKRVNECDKSLIQSKCRMNKTRSLHTYECIEKETQRGRDGERERARAIKYKIDAEQ